VSGRFLPSPKAFIFDIGRVIVRVNINRALATLGADAHLSAEQVWAAIQNDSHWQDWQEGRMTPRDWHQHLSDRLGFRLSLEQFASAWNSALGPDPLLDENLFAELAPRYRLVLLSNTDPLHMAHLESAFRFPRHFPARVYSCTVGASKPDAAIYQHAIREAQALPDQIVYVDDVADYVEAGRRAGMQGILFESPRQLLAELRRRGIIQ
jgi:HAD superfamily hydrolase (TIGR01509 family)